jgi:hypothetical protein
LKAKLQGLNERKKEAGQTPRHNRSTSKYDDIEIPLIHGLDTVHIGTSSKRFSPFGKRCD